MIGERKSILSAALRIGQSRESSGTVSNTAGKKAFQFKEIQACFPFDIPVQGCLAICQIERAEKMHDLPLDGCQTRKAGFPGKFFRNALCPALGFDKESFIVQKDFLAANHPGGVAGRPSGTPIFRSGQLVAPPLRILSSTRSGVAGK